MKPPMLAGKAPADLSKLKYPVWGSYKYDGIRATSWGGVLYSRSLKPIPNKLIQLAFAGLEDGIDGELIFGDPTAADVFQRSTSVCMSDTHDLSGHVKLYAFDMVGDRPFESRQVNLIRAIKNRTNVTRVWQINIATLEELLEYEAEAMQLGYEGVMLRGAESPYKHGRSTEREGYLLKLKSFEDHEAVVIGQTFKQHNSNEAVRNATGHLERSSKKAGLVATKLLGSLVVRGLNGPFKGVEFEIGTGFTEAQRIEFGQRDLRKLVCKYKHQLAGSKDRPRFPVFLGWRKD